MTGRLPTWFGKYPCFQLLLFVVVVCRGSVVLVVVWLWSFCRQIAASYWCGWGNEQVENIAGQTMWPRGRRLHPPFMNMCSDYRWLNTCANHGNQALSPLPSLGPRNAARWLLTSSCNFEASNMAYPIWYCCCGLQ